MMKDSSFSYNASANPPASLLAHRLFSLANSPLSLKVHSTAKPSASAASWSPISNCTASSWPSKVATGCSNAGSMPKSGSPLILAGTSRAVSMAPDSEISISSRSACVFCCPWAAPTMATWLTVTVPATTSAVDSRVDLIVIWLSLLEVVEQNLARNSYFAKDTPSSRTCRKHDIEAGLSQNKLQNNISQTLG